MWIDPIFEPLKAKTGRDFSVMLLTKNEPIGSLAEVDLQAIKLELTGRVVLSFLIRPNSFPTINVVFYHTIYELPRCTVASQSASYSNEM